jgi:hypothetical protein
MTSGYQIGNLFPDYGSGFTTDDEIMCHGKKRGAREVSPALLPAATLAASLPIAAQQQVVETSMPATPASTTPASAPPGQINWMIFIFVVLLVMLALEIYSTKSTISGAAIGHRFCPECGGPI